MPAFTHPSELSIPNFMYAENFEQLKIWCFDPNSSVRFDDSSNFLYSLSVWSLIHFFNMATIKSVMLVNALSMLLSIYLLIKIVDSRFFSVNLLLVGLLFMSTQIWAGVLGDEIIFRGMLWLLAVHAFWKHHYWVLMLASAFNIMARPDNTFIVLPLVFISYQDYKNVKERDRRKFVFRRVRRTVNFFIIPLVAFFAYRYFYFGKVLPYNWLHHSLETDKSYGIFNYNSMLYVRHYMRFYTLPLAIGVAFYFLKERQQLHIRYYGLALSMIILPIIYMCTFSQDENLFFKNQYALYLGFIILSLLFIRDYRSISQGITTAIFVLFFGFKIAFFFFKITLQSYNNNAYYIANDLAQIHNGKAIVYEESFIPWMTEWQTTYASGKHTKDGREMTASELEASLADIIVTEKKEDMAVLKDKYEFFRLPVNIRQYEKEFEPENSLDKFFYKYSHRLKIDRTSCFHVLVWKFGNNYNEVKDILVAHGGREGKL
jgi:hypothetical protein